MPLWLLLSTLLCNAARLSKLNRMHADVNVALVEQSTQVPVRILPVAACVPVGLAWLAIATEAQKQSVADVESAALSVTWIPWLSCFD